MLASFSLSTKASFPFVRRTIRLSTRSFVSSSYTTQPRCIPHKTPPPFPRTVTHAFSTTHVAHKRKKHSAKDVNDSEDPSDGKESPPDLDDFSALEDAIASAHKRLKTDLSELRPGGKINPGVVENLRVQLGKDSKTERLSDVAQVVQRGRNLNVLFGDQNVGYRRAVFAYAALDRFFCRQSTDKPSSLWQHAKPISSAIQRSNLNLTPQPDSQSSLQLNITLPPVTTESRMEAVKAATQLGQKTSTAVQTARATQHKTLQSMKNDKRITADDFKRACKRMDEVVERGNTDVKRIVDNAKKILESG